MPTRRQQCRDWTLLLGGAMLLALLLAFCNWFLFIRRHYIPVAEIPAPDVSFSREGLDEVLEAFARRAAEYEAARRSLPSVADPGK